MSIRESNVHGANMGPIRGRQDPSGSHIGPMNFAIWDHYTHAHDEPLDEVKVQSTQQIFINNVSIDVKALYRKPGYPSFQMV